MASACLNILPLSVPRGAPVLVTGAAGRVGRAVTAALRAQGWRVRAFDRAPVPDVEECVTGDLADFAALGNAFTDVGALIHLAATPDDDDFATRLVPDNVQGVFHVVEAARRAGLKRLVLASSGQVNDAQQYAGPWPICADDPPTPRHWYAATKLFLESAGRSYARQEGAVVIAARLGWCPRAGQEREIAAWPAAQDVYLSPEDAGSFFAACVGAEVVPGFHAVYAASQPARRNIFDLEATERLLGWRPRQQWPQGVEALL